MPLAYFSLARCERVKRNLQVDLVLVMSDRRFVVIDDDKLLDGEENFA